MRASWRGARVLLVARGAGGLERAREDLLETCPAAQVHCLAADVRDAEDRLAIFDWVNDLGWPLSILVNNAGSDWPDPEQDDPEEALRAMLELNLVSVAALCRLARPRLRETAHAAVVNIGTVAAPRHPDGSGACAASKAGVEQLTRSLAGAWAADGIRVNAVSPWYVRTRQSERALADPDYLERVLERTPLGRIGEPEDVAAAVAFLCLPAAAFITGVTLAVDGGFLQSGI